MPVKTSPMDSERPKTPSWAFSAPDLVKNSKSYGLCHFSPSSSVTGSPFCTCGKVNLAPERFRVHKPSTRASRKTVPKCRTVNGTQAPKLGGVGRMGGHMATSQRPPDPPPNANIFEFKYFKTYNGKNKGAAVAYWDGFVKPLYRGEVRGSNPTASMKFYKMNQQPTDGCHVAALDWATWHAKFEMNCHVSTNYSSSCHPIKICHISQTAKSSAMCACHVSTVRPCHVAVRPAQSASSFFLPVWLGEQTSITSPYGLRLRK
jgi:hypothetical protein